MTLARRDQKENEKRGGRVAAEVELGQVRTVVSVGGCTTNHSNFVMGATRNGVRPGAPPHDAF